MTETRPRVRFAGPADLPLLSAIEDDGERAFAGLMDTSGWGPSRTGEQRAADAGFILVAGRPPVGYAHVLDLGGHQHLEQLDVLGARRRQGIGSVLVEQACRVAAERGATELTLMTFADVPFNGPFYAGLGFVEVPEPLPDFLLPLHQTEERVGLTRQGRRVAMVRSGLQRTSQRRSGHVGDGGAQTAGPTGGR